LHVTEHVDQRTKEVLESKTSEHRTHNIAIEILAQVYNHHDLPWVHLTWQKTISQADCPTCQCSQGFILVESHHQVIRQILHDGFMRSTKWPHCFVLDKFVGLGCLKMEVYLRILFLHNAQRPGFSIPGSYNPSYYNVWHNNSAEN
jgi:hypothetical protein